MMTLLETLSTVTLALTAAPAQVGPAPAPPPSNERMVCRTQEKMGSRLGGKRICYTKARWKEIESDSMGAVRDFQQQRSSNPTNGG